MINTHPFVMKQKIEVYKEGECVETLESNFDNIENLCYELCKEYDINQVNLIGNKMFNMKIKKDMNTKYSDSDIIITLY